MAVSTDQSGLSENGMGKRQRANMGSPSTLTLFILLAGVLAIVALDWHVRRERAIAEHRFSQRYQNLLSASDVEDRWWRDTILTPLSQTLTPHSMVDEIEEDEATGPAAAAATGGGGRSVEVRLRNLKERPRRPIPAVRKNAEQTDDPARAMQRVTRAFDTIRAWRRLALPTADELALSKLPPPSVDIPQKRH